MSWCSHRGTSFVARRKALNDRDPNHATNKNRILEWKVTYLAIFPKEVVRFVPSPLCCLFVERNVLKRLDISIQKAL